MTETREAQTKLPERYGRWALIAGSSAGLGAAFAMSAARHGFNVVLLARREGKLKESALRVRTTYGVKTRCIVADLARPDIDAVIEDGTDDLDIGVFVHNAAHEAAGRFIDVPLEQHRLNLAVNCWTPTLLSYRFARKMSKNGRGAIVLVTSMAALQGIKLYATYGGAKAYQQILAETLWDEFREEGIDVVGYVVGATVSANFAGIREGAYDNVSKGAKDASSRVLKPLSSEEVAERLFERLDGGPRLFSDARDEAAYRRGATRPWADVVRQMGELSSGMAFARW